MQRSEGCNRCLCACVVVLVIFAVGSAIAAVVVLGFFFFNDDIYSNVTSTTTPGMFTTAGKMYPNTHSTMTQRIDLFTTTETMPPDPLRIQMGRQIIQGHTVMAPQGDSVYEFLGIPYAKPPIGNLRFADPEPLDAFPDDVFNATEYGNTCPQFLTQSYPGYAPEEQWNPTNTRDEDCLSLNVWVPSTDTQNKAVMIWLYGGGFMSGSSQLWLYNGKTLADYGDVIVVSINFRTGAFGFLSDGEGNIKGNFGLKDMALALQWVHDNIYKFGGNPDEITLFGESSGAASIGYLMVAPQTKNLYKRAIFQSGAPDSRWSYMDLNTAKARYNRFLADVKCDSATGYEEQLTCLRGKSQRTILNNQWVIFDYMVFEWVPTIDGELVTDAPWNLFNNTDFSNHQFILGSNKDEGSFWNLYSLPYFSYSTDSLQTYAQFKDSARLIDWDLINTTQTHLIEYYTIFQIRDTSNESANRDALDRMGGDRAFTCPTERLARTLASSGADVYYYYLTHRASNEGWHEWLGVIHGADIQWVFGMPLDEAQGYTDDEVELSKKIMQYYTNFAKTGNPEGNNLPSWPKFTADDRKYLEWRSSSQFVEGAKLRNGFCELYNDIRQDITDNHDRSRR